MKKILLATVFFCCWQLCTVSLHAQTLYGTTVNGGDDGVGTINQFIPANNDLKVVKSFESFAATPYYTNFIQATDGKLYGMTSEKGSQYLGVIFSFDPSSSTYTTLKDFDGSNGGNRDRLPGQ